MSYTFIIQVNCKINHVLIIVCFKFTWLVLYGKEHTFQFLINLFCVIFIYSIFLDFILFLSWINAIKLDILESLTNAIGITETAFFSLNYSEEIQKFYAHFIQVWFNFILLRKSVFWFFIYIIGDYLLKKFHVWLVTCD